MKHRITQRLAPVLARFRRDQDGNSTVNFAITFPTLIALLFSIFEAGWLMTQIMMLERAVDIAGREIRLGTAESVDHDTLKTELCTTAYVLKNCEEHMVLEVVEMDLDADYPQNQANCVDRTGAIEPKITFDPSGSNRIMFLRACMVVDPIIPGIGMGLMLPKDDSGGVQLTAYTAFMNEPL